VAVVVEGIVGGRLKSECFRLDTLMADLLPDQPGGGVVDDKKIDARDSGGGPDDNENRVLAAAPG
jgi:hypothetical protein